MNVKIRFLLKKKGPRGPHPVYIAPYGGEQTELIYTGHRVFQKDWSESERQPKIHTSDVSLAINRMRSNVLSSQKLFEAQNRPATPFTIKEHFLKEMIAREMNQKDQDKKAKKELNTIARLALDWQESKLFAYRESTQKAVRESIRQFLDYLVLTGQGKIDYSGLN